MTKFVSIGIIKWYFIDLFYHMKFNLSTLKKQFSYIILEDGDKNSQTNDRELTSTETWRSAQEAVVIQNTKREVRVAEEDVYQNDNWVPAWIHETLETDADLKKRIGKRFDALNHKAEKNRAKQAAYEDKKRDVILNNNDINDIEKDKFDIAYNYFEDLLKPQLSYLKDKYGRREAKRMRIEAYKAVTTTFLREHREWENGYDRTGKTDNSNVANLRFEVGTNLENIAPIQLNYTNSKELFDKLAKKDNEEYVLALEWEKKALVYEYVAKDGTVTKDELKWPITITTKNSDGTTSTETIQWAFSNRSARRVARFDRKQKQKAERSLEIDEKVDEKYKMYTNEIANTLTGTTSVDVYTNKWKKKEQLWIEEIQLTDFDRFCLIACDYNMDGDITPKPLKEQFAREKWLWRRLLWETRTNRYNRKSKGEKPLTISASQLRESMRIAKAEVGEVRLVQNLLKLINTNLFVDTEHDKMSQPLDANTIKTSDQLFDAVSSDYHYIKWFREWLANFPSNVTDLLTMGDLQMGENNLYVEETQRLIAFDPQKEEKIAWELAQVQLSDVKDTWENIENDPKLTASEKVAVQEFHKLVTEHADQQRLIWLKQLQEIRDSWLVTDETELKTLNAKIAELDNSSLMLPQLTMQWIAAFMLFNFQWADIREKVTKDLAGNVTSIRTEWIRNKEDTWWDTIFKETTTNPDGTTKVEWSYDLKDRLKQTSLNAIWIGTGGTLVNFQNRGSRYADNISRWANALSFIGRNQRQQQDTIKRRNEKFPGKSLPAALANKDYTERWFGASISVWYNGWSIGLGKQIGDTQYHPVTLSFGTWVSEWWNNLLGRSTGLYAYARPGWMRNAGKLQQTLDARSAKESGITGSLWFDVKNKKRWKGVQFDIIRKDYIKWYEIVADSIRGTAPQVILNILQQMQGDSDAWKAITPERLKAAVRAQLTADGNFDRNKNNSVMVDRMSTRLYAMMRTMYPGIETGDAKIIQDLDNPEVAQGVADNLAFNLSLNWLNENYDKLKWLKWTGLGADLQTILLAKWFIAAMIAWVAIPAIPIATGVWALASFVFTNIDWYKQSNIQEEDATGKRNSDMMKTYNIWARKLEGDLVDHVAHVNEKIQILTNNKWDFVTAHTDRAWNPDGMVRISNQLLWYASTVPVYLNPIYGPQWDKAWYYKSIQESEKESGWLLIPGHLAAGIMTNIGKTKDGALYIGYEATDKNIFQSETKDGKERNQKAVLRSGQQFNGSPEQFKATSEWYEKTEFETLWNDKDRFVKLREKFDAEFINGNIIKVTEKSSKKSLEIDMTKQKLVFESKVDEAWVYTTMLPTAGIPLADKEKFQIIHTITTTKKWVDAESDESKELSFGYAVKMDFGVDPSRNRSALKWAAEYKQLSHEVDKLEATDRTKAATLATAIITKYNATHKDKITAHTFSADKKEEIIQFMHELIGSAYCSVSERQVKVWIKWKWFTGLMTERTLWFRERWKNDKTTNKVPVEDMEAARNKSLKAMFDINPSLNLTLWNYMDAKVHGTTQYSFRDEYPKSPSNPTGHTIIAWFIYGYNGLASDGKTKTHDEKLVLSPNIVEDSDQAIESASMRAYTMHQVVARYDVVYGPGAFIKEIGRQIEFEGVKAEDIAAIMNGSSTSVEINGWTLEITPKSFFYPECFNEWGGVSIAYKKNTKVPWAPSTETLEEKWTLDAHISTGATWMFVNNITIGMNTEKRSIKWAVWVWALVKPMSWTRITAEEKAGSTTHITIEQLWWTPGIDIPNGWVRVTLGDGRVLWIDKEEGTGNYYVTISGSDDILTYTDLKWVLDQYKPQMSNDQFTALNDYYLGKYVPGQPVVTTDNLWAPKAPARFGMDPYNNMVAGQAEQNAMSTLQSPDVVTRNMKQQAIRRRRPRAI